ncbi:DUF1697 domain-containing protein [Microlunatus flavus]|uniref:Uncharacterized conserved protein, DUF1697 family n=1 Tax=Microlunatus flavus TaxID=1036181 RepID=A0A1H9FA34_9ACTN|nr:DUF1697 domain-containing protein [Microlunatus flavus]SEQ34777.1 Uncharacterized conserved protein, DUF1697 family [Microlunatus flavus]
MTTYVAFLRGVNLGPHRAVSMPRLVELAEGLGHEDVWTYLRTGNLVLTSTQAAGTVERGLARALEEEYGTTTDVTVRTADQLRALVADNPFPDGSASQVTVTFLTADPPPGLEDRLAAMATPAEPYEVHGREVWVRFGDGLARSRLAAGLSKVVGVSATTRTVGTVAKLVAGIDKRAG